jgi:hypothetical protein
MAVIGGNAFAPFVAPVLEVFATAIAGDSRALYASALGLSQLLRLVIPFEDPERWLELLLAAIAGSELSANARCASVARQRPARPCPPRCSEDEADRGRVFAAAHDAHDWRSCRRTTGDGRLPHLLRGRLPGSVGAALEEQ